MLTLYQNNPSYIKLNLGCLPDPNYQLMKNSATLFKPPVFKNMNDVNSSPMDRWSGDKAGLSSFIQLHIIRKSN